MYARRTESLDAAELEKLINPNIEYIFGKRNLNDIIEKAILSVTLTSAENEILGYASFYDYPNVSTIDSSQQWNELMVLPGYELATPLNCLFMHYFVYEEGRESSVLMEIITTVFNTGPDIHYIMMNIAADLYLDKFTDQFKIINTKNDSFNWYGLKRESYMPRLHIRAAKPEDQDDLTPIFDAQTDVLKKIYGEFYIAEMIDAQNDNRKCLVAEVVGTAIGFMSVTTDTNIDLLHHGYFVESFKGFMKPINLDEPNKTDLSNNEEEPSVSSKEHSVPIDAQEIEIEPNLIESSSHHTSEIAGQLHSSVFTSEDTLGYQSEDPHFPGMANVILIQLFAINDMYEMRSFDFVTKVFELFPTKDYLLITIPHLVPEFTLLENFARVTPRPGINVPHELYVFHRGSLINNFNVRVACKTDLSSISSLIDNLTLSKNILEDLEQYFTARRSNDGTNLYAYVAECIGKVVGIAILQDEDDIEYIRSHYNIEDFIYFTHHRRQEHAHIKHFALNPVFKRLSKVFIKEVMRKAHKSSFYFPVYKPWASKEKLKEHSLPTILPELVPVRPRRQIIYDIKKLKNNAPTGRVLQIQEAYCLLHINRKLIMEPKLAINARIVVIGASTTGLSFLESLVFCPHLKFNNLFLVSPKGIMDEYKDDKYVEQLMGKNFYFSKRKLELSAIRIQVSVIKGSMTAIDRKKKLITINNKFLLPYDHMIIATGLQYAIPCPTEMKDGLPNTKLSKPMLNTSDRRYSELIFKSRINKGNSIIEKRPYNMLLVNDPFGALSLLEFIQTHLTGGDSNIIVYGHSFETYCCIHTLLEVGISGRRIHYIKPPSVNEVFPLNNPVVEKAVYQTLSESGISVYTNYTLSRYNYSNEMPYQVTSATFTGEGPSLYLNCQLFVSYYNPVVNYKAFRAMNDSCLVFDARLVIDSFFHTNDISIRAAGPVTKFKRRYYSDQWNHSKFSSKVVGEELSKVFLRLFDPTLEPTIKPPKEEVPLIPFYRDPILQSSVLPGGFHYLNVYKPRLEASLATMMQQPNYGYVLSTGEPQKDQGYFRLHLDQYMKVESITCLRRRPFPVENYIQIFGVHERALNNLQSRFNEGLIKDLFEFFDDTWAMAFYHDRFKDLKEELTELLMTRPLQSVCKTSLEETIREMMTSGAELTTDQKKEIMDEYRSSGAKTAVDQRLISFIAYNYYHLPMYAKPDMV